MGCVYLSTAQTCSCSLHGSNSRAPLYEISNIISTATNRIERKSAGGYRSAGVSEAFRIILGLMFMEPCIARYIFYITKRDTTYTMFFIIISALHVSGGFPAHHQELIKLCVQP